MKTTTIQFDERSQKEIDRLKVVFGATSNAAVVRKALALASMVAEEADENQTVTVSGRIDKEPIRVSLSR